MFETLGFVGMLAVLAWLVFLVYRDYRRESKHYSSLKDPNQVTLLDRYERSRDKSNDPLRSRRRLDE